MILALLLNLNGIEIDLISEFTNDYVDGVIYIKTDFIFRSGFE